jgi:glycosyltransferase involved in cell wall biosynthesis
VNEPLLTIGYSVLGSRVAGIRLPPPRADVEVLVVVQGPAAGPAPLRADVRYVHLESTGVTKSRNEVMAQARGRFLLFADDDVVLHEEGIRRLLSELQRDDDLALAVGASVDEQGRPRKRYPRRAVRLHRWNAGKAATYEMMLRRSAFLRTGVRFDEHFGAGTENYLGDEYILIADAIHVGMRGRFFPYTVATHPVVSSGSRFGTVGDAAARAAVFRRVFGWSAPLARLAFVLRTPSRHGSVMLAARFVVNRFST